SVSHASMLVGQLVAHYGQEMVHPVTGASVRLFPSATKLARSDLSELKTTQARRDTIRELSRRVASGDLDLSDAQDPVAFRQMIRGIKGVGAWSAEYISLRAIGDTDAFPATDLILQRVLELHPNLDLVA